MSLDNILPALIKWKQLGRLAKKSSVFQNKMFADTISLLFIQLFSLNVISERLEIKSEDEKGVTSNYVVLQR